MNVRHPPAHVELLVAFTNSVDHELETDDLTSPAGLTQWLNDHGLLDAAVEADDEDLAMARQLRDALHSALAANHIGSVDCAALEDVGAQLPLRVTAGVGGPVLRPVDDGVRGALGMLLVAVQDSVADETWQRVKICLAADCYWAYFDTTKNQSRAWCEWGCGNKAKTRAYRARKKAAAAPS